MMPLGNAPALMTVSADEPYRLGDEVVAQEPMCTDMLDERTSE